MRLYKTSHIKSDVILIFNRKILFVGAFEVKKLQIFEILDSFLNRLTNVTILFIVKSSPFSLSLTDKKSQDFYAFAMTSVFKISISVE